VGLQPLEESYQSYSLDVKEAGAADERRESGRGEPRESSESEQAARPEDSDSLLYVGPCRVLGEDCADRYLERSIAGPPVLWPKRLIQPPVDETEVTADTRSLDLSIPRSLSCAELAS